MKITIKSKESDPAKAVLLINSKKVRNFRQQLMIICDETENWITPDLILGAASNNVLMTAAEVQIV